MPFRSTLSYALIATLVTASAGHAAGAQPDEPWTQLRGDAAASGQWTGSLNPAGVEKAWSTQAALDSELEFVTGAQPVLSDDGNTIFALAAEGPMDPGNGHIIALDTNTGHKLWSHQVLHHSDFTSTSSPAYQDGAVYWAGGYEIPESRNETTFDEKTRAYRINGQTGTTNPDDGGWVVDIDGSGQGIVNASPTIAQDQFFITTYGGFYPDRPTQHAFDIEDGSQTWKHTDGGRVPGAMTHDAARGLVYQLIYGDHGADGEGDYLRAYDAETGQIAWTSPWTLDQAASSQTMTLINDTLYFQDQGFDDGTNLYRLDLPETLDWKTDAGTISRAAAAVSPDGNIFTAGQDIGGYGSDGPGQIRAHDAEGNLLWSFDDLAGGFSNSPVWTDGYVLIGQETGDTFYLLDETDGSVVRELTGSGPAAFGTDQFYTIGQDGVLHAYTIPEPSSLALLSGGALLLLRPRR